MHPERTGDRLRLLGGWRVGTRALYASLVEFRVLGPLELLEDGRSVELPAGKPRALLGLLILEAGRVVSTDRILNGLWGERPPATAAKVVQGYVSRLRKLLGEGVLQTAPGGYRLRAEPGSIDVDRFHDLLKRGRALQAGLMPDQAAVALAEALALWRGPALSDFRYEPFAQDEIGRLEELRLVAVELRVEADLALGHAGEIVGELEVLVRHHPLRENLRRLLMLALYRSGRQTDALAAYQDARSALVEELGLDPGESLQQLERAILRHEPSLDLVAANAVPRTNLPVPASPFIGREQEVSALVELLGDGVRLLTLTGPGGIGKTRLALQAAAGASEGFPDGVFWAPLAALRDSARVLAEVAAAVGVRQGEGGSALDDLSSGLAGKKLLLCCDNVEHLLPPAAEHLARLAGDCPTVTVVVTSRERLRVDGERVFAVPPMSETDGEALFRHRAADAGSGVESSLEVRKLCARLDNLPLALELAAARTAVFSPAQLLDRLPQRLDLFRGGRAIDARQATLRATIAWSHDLLDLDEKQLLRRLSVFPGGCSYDAAERVAGAVPDTLQSLLDKSLLRRGDSPAGPRFWMLETIREYAAQQLAAAGETSDLEHRHRDYYAEIAEACYDETWEGHDDLEQLEAERDNLRFALDIALETDPELALELATHLTTYCVDRGEYREGREKLASALAQTPNRPTLSRASALLASVTLAMNQVDMAAHDALAREALELSRTLADRLREGRALCFLGISAHRRGDLAEAERLLNEAVDTLNIPGGEFFRQWALGITAQLLSTIGDHHGALARQREIVAATRRQGSASNLARHLNNLGELERAAGELARARQSLEESVALNRQLANKSLLSSSLHSLGCALQASAPADALAAFAESLQLARDMDDPNLVAFCLEGAAPIFIARLDPAHAASLLGAASTIRNRLSDFRTPHEKAEVETAESQCRQALTSETFTASWQQGAALDTNAATWALEAWEQAGRNPPYSSRP